MTCTRAMTIANRPVSCCNIPCMCTYQSRVALSPSLPGHVGSPALVSDDRGSLLLAGSLGEQTKIHFDIF